MWSGELVAALRVGLVLAVAVTVGAVGAGAREATPGAATLFSELGLPELTLIATDSGLVLSRSVVPAGRYLITLDNQSWDPDLVVPFVMLFPDGGAACAEGLVPPDCEVWSSQNSVPGGVSGDAPHAVIELLPGEYGLWGGDELSTTPSATLTVTGSADSAIHGPAPETATIFATKGEGGFGFALRLQGELRAGSQIVRIVNEADQTIFITAVQAPERAIIAEAFAGEETDELYRVATTVTQSPRTTQWVELHLMSGWVDLGCNIPDPVRTRETLDWYEATSLLVGVSARA